MQGDDRTSLFRLFLLNAQLDAKINFLPTFLYFISYLPTSLIFISPFPLLGIPTSLLPFPSSIILLIDESFFLRASSLPHLQVFQQRKRILQKQPAGALANPIVKIQPNADVCRLAHQKVGF